MRRESDIKEGALVVRSYIMKREIKIVLEKNKIPESIRHDSEKVLDFKNRKQEEIRNLYFAFHVFMTHVFKNDKETECAYILKNMGIISSDVFEIMEYFRKKKANRDDPCVLLEEKRSAHVIDTIQISEREMFDKNILDIRSAIHILKIVFQQEGLQGCLEGLDLLDPNEMKIYIHSRDIYFFYEMVHREINRYKKDKPNIFSCPKDTSETVFINTLEHAAERIRVESAIREHFEMTQRREVPPSFVGLRNFKKGDNVYIYQDGIFIEETVLAVDQNMLLFKGRAPLPAHSLGVFLQEDVEPLEKKFLAGKDPDECEKKYGEKAKDIFTRIHGKWMINQQTFTSTQHDNIWNDELLTTFLNGFSEIQIEKDMTSFGLFNN